MTDPKAETDTRKPPYEKPMLRIIDLAADDVLAVGCKVQTGTSGFGNTKASCLYSRQCFGASS